jgi:thymidylate synthase
MTKVYVVVDEFYGTIADVNVYKNEPKNLKTISEDESQRCFKLEIKENQDDT